MSLVDQAFTFTFFRVKYSWWNLYVSFIISRVESLRAHSRVLLHSVHVWESVGGSRQGVANMAMAPIENIHTGCPQKYLMAWIMALTWMNVQYYYSLKVMQYHVMIKILLKLNTITSLWEKKINKKFLRDKGIPTPPPSWPHPYHHSWTHQCWERCCYFQTTVCILCVCNICRRWCCVYSFLNQQSSDLHTYFVSNLRCTVINDQNKIVKVKNVK